MAPITVLSNQARPSNATASRPSRPKLSAANPAATACGSTPPSSNRRSSSAGDRKADAASPARCSAHAPSKISSRLGGKNASIAKGASPHSRFTAALTMATTPSITGHCRRGARASSTTAAALAYQTVAICPGWRDTPIDKQASTV